MNRISRRRLVGGFAGLAAGTRLATPDRVSRGQDRQPAPGFSYPIGQPGQPPGVGFFIRHGYAVENTWFAPGNLHAGEDWFAIEGDTAGAQVLAIAAGEVVFSGFDYPGEVVILQHAADLFSMYGHLDPALAVAVGQTVARAEVLGTIAIRVDDYPNHLHVETRTFFTTPEVNGDRPRYNFLCGVQCPPGPGYWPINAPEHPSAIGWRNPTHLIGQRAFRDSAGAPLAEVTVTSEPPVPEVAIWSLPEDDPAAEQTGTLPLAAGERFQLLDIVAGPPDSVGTSATAYALWYRLALIEEESGWVQAAFPTSFETGSDGRPSTVRLLFYPVIPPS